MNTKNVIGGLLAGAAIGVAIGMLLAPYSGERTREKLLKGARKLTDGMKGTVDDSIDLIKDKFHSGVDELARKGKDALYTPNERVKI